MAQKLLGHIPRLEPVLEILAVSSAKSEGREGMTKQGAAILRLVQEYDAHLAQGHTARAAVDAVRAQTSRHDSALIEALESMVGAAPGTDQVSEVFLGRVTPGMVFVDDVRTSVGALLVPKGFEVTETFLERLRNFGPGILQERVRITRPSAAAEAAPAA